MDYGKNFSYGGYGADCYYFGLIESYKCKRVASVALFFRWLFWVCCVCINDIYGGSYFYFFVFWVLVLGEKALESEVFVLVCTFGVCFCEPLGQRVVFCV